MLLSAHQPAYLPWPGYLDKIRQADVFVVLDTVQRSHGDWSNRNRIKTQNGELMLTVPLRGSRQQPFFEIRTDEGQKWRQKHVRSVQQAYGVDISDWISGSDRLTDLCSEQLARFLDEFGIKTPVSYLRGVSLGGKNDLILRLCERYGADQFLFGAQGRDYCDFEAFERAGVEPLFQDYRPKEYPQLHGDFIPGLSALDLLLNCGEGAKDFL